MDDSQILALFNARSEQAIAELEKTHGRSVKKMIQNILGNAQDTEECESDTYWIVWNQIPPQVPQSLRAFACGIARNTALDRYRANTAKKRNSFYDAALEELEDSIPALQTVETEYEAKELAGLINAFLKKQRYDDRYAFVRRYYYADSVTDIARQMGVTPHRISVRLFRIRSKLQDYLGKEGYLL